VLGIGVGVDVAEVHLFGAGRQGEEALVIAGRRGDVSRCLRPEAGAE